MSECYALDGVAYDLCLFGAAECDAQAGFETGVAHEFDFVPFFSHGLLEFCFGWGI